MGKLKDKFNSLYLTILIPSILTGILGCLFVSVTLQLGTKATMKEFYNNELSQYVDLIFNAINSDNDDFKRYVINISKENERDGSSTVNNPEQMLRNITDAYQLYNAVFLDKDYSILYSLKDDFILSANSEYKAIEDATNGIISSYVTVKNNEVLLSSAIQISDMILLLQHEISSIRVLEKYASLLDCVMTIFIDDVRIETTIRDGNGVYLKGTKLNNSKIYNIVYQDKDVYHGANVINGKNYVTIYAPFENDDDQKVMIFMGISDESIEQITARVTSTTIPAPILVVVLIVLIEIIIFSRFVMHRLKGTLVAFNNLNGGKGQADLTMRIAVKKQDEIGKMSNAINLFISTLQKMLREISNSSNDLEFIGEGLASTSQQSASAVSEIMANIQSIRNSVVKQSKALEDVQDSLGKNIQEIKNLDNLIETQSAGIVQSSSAIEEMIGNISSVTKSINKMTDEYKNLMKITNEGKNNQNIVVAQIQEMVAKSQRLAEANKVISKISTQTNLLAMNAAIEASHAGNAGKGFSVVADEIRKLAVDSAKQSKEIGNELAEIIETIEMVSSASEQSTLSFDAIAKKVESTDRLVVELDTAMSEQQEASKQVLISLKEINDDSSKVLMTSRNMSNGITEVVTATNNLDMIAKSVEGSMDEITSGIGEITSSTQNVSNMATQTKDNITLVKNNISKFILQ